MKRKELAALLIFITLLHLLSAFSVSAEEYTISHYERTFSHDGDIFYFRMSPMPYGTMAIRFYVVVKSAQTDASFMFIKTPKYAVGDICAFDVSEFQPGKLFEKGERLEVSVIVDYKQGMQSPAKSHGLYFYDATGDTPKMKNFTPVPLENRTCFSEDGKYFRTDITDLADKFEYNYTLTLRSEDDPDRSITFSDYPAYAKGNTYGFAIPEEMRKVFDYGERLSLTLSAMDAMTGDTYMQNAVSGYVYDVKEEASPDVIPPVVPPVEPPADPPQVQTPKEKVAPKWVYLCVFAVCAVAVLLAAIFTAADRKR